MEDRPAELAGGCPRVAVVAPARVAALALVSAPAPTVEPSADLEAAWEAEESALARSDLEGAVAAVVKVWTLPDAPPGLRDRIANMQRRAFELQAHAGDVPPADDPLEPDSSALRSINALAQSFVDSFKTELISDRVWRTRSQLELVIVAYVAWFNNDRLHEALGDIPPAEFDALHATETQHAQPA